jgi:hypothetical protein
LTSEKFPLNLVGAALLPGLGIDSVERVVMTNPDRFDECDRILDKKMIVYLYKQEEASLAVGLQ